MNRLRLLCLVFGLTIWLGISARAQEGFDLPTELYVLLADGRLQRFGLGAAGIDTLLPSDPAAVIVDFAIAPDGETLALRTTNGLEVGGVVVDAQADFPPLRGQGASLAWSPQGDALAYTTSGGLRLLTLGRIPAWTDSELKDASALLWSPQGTHIAALGQDAVWWVYRREGQALALASIVIGATSLVWRDESTLLYADGVAGGIVQMDLSAGNALTPLVADGEAYQLLAYNAASGTLRAMQGEASAATLVELGAGGALAVLGQSPLDVNGAAWSPDGRLLLVFTGGVIALQDPVSGAGFPLPIASASAYGWGALYPPRLNAVQLPADAYALAPDVAGVVQVWQVPRTGELPRTLSAAASDVSDYSIAFGARQLAYVSDGQLWVQAIGTESPAQAVVALNAGAGAQPAFSVDGERIFFVDTVGDVAGIYSLRLSGGAATAFLPAHRLPQPSPATNALLATNAAGQVAVFNAETGEPFSYGADVPIPTRARWVGGTRFVGVVGDELHQYDVNDLSRSTLLGVLPLTEAVLEYDFRVGNGSGQAVLAYAPVRRADLVTLNEEASLPTPLTYIHTPRLAPDGSAILGLGRLGGGLLLIDLATGSTAYLLLPGAHEVRWGE